MTSLKALAAAMRFQLGQSASQSIIKPNCKIPSEFLSAVPEIGRSETPDVVAVTIAIDRSGDNTATVTNTADFSWIDR